MKYIKTYKIFEASKEELNEYLSDIRTEVNYILLKLKEEGDINITITTALLSKQYQDPSEYYINVNINNCDKIEKFTDEIKTLFSYLGAEDIDKPWSLKSTLFTDSKSYCDVEYEYVHRYFEDIYDLLEIISSGVNIEGIDIKFFKLI